MLLPVLLIFLPASGESCSLQPVSINHFSFHSELMNRDFEFAVYIPPCMDDRIIGGYPVVYLLHGQDMGIEIWEEMGMDQIMRETLNTSDIPLFLTVVPQEEQFLLSLSISEFGDVVVNELIPWVDEHFNTCGDRHCRSLGGLSRGALWAEKIAFEHPDLFGSVGLLSMPGTFTDDQSIYYIAEKHLPDHQLRIRIDVGSEDNYRHEAIKASSQLTYIGYPYEYAIQPGAHDADYWKNRLGDYFVWFSQDWVSGLSLPEP